MRKCVIWAPFPAIREHRGRLDDHIAHDRGDENLRRLSPVTKSFDHGRESLVAARGCESGHVGRPSRPVPIVAEKNGVELARKIKLTYYQNLWKQFDPSNDVEVSREPNGAFPPPQDHRTNIQNNDSVNKILRLFREEDH